MITVPEPEFCPVIKLSDVRTTGFHANEEAILALRVTAVWSPEHMVLEGPEANATTGNGLTVTKAVPGLPVQPKRDVGVMVYVAVADVGEALTSVLFRDWLITLPLPGAVFVILEGADTVQVKVLVAVAPRLILILASLQIVTGTIAVRLGLGFTLTLILSLITLGQKAGAGEVTATS